MVRQFYKGKIFIEKEANNKMVQEEVAPFEPEVNNFVNVITIENEDKEDLKIALGLPMEIEKTLQHLLNGQMTELSIMHKNSLKGNIKIQMVFKTQFYGDLSQLMESLFKFCT